MSLPASEQSQVRVAFKAMATKWGFFCPRTENSKLWQVNLLTQSVRAKFTELVNTVVFSCDWSQHLPAFPWLWRNMKVKKINYWAPLQKKNKKTVSLIHTVYRNSRNCSSLSKRVVFSMHVPALCWWGSWKHTLTAPIRALCCSASNWMSLLLLSCETIMEPNVRMWFRHTPSHIHVRTPAHQTHWVTWCQPVVVPRRMTV